MKDFLDNLSNTISIVDVISEKTNLTKKGSEYIGLCPFHSEKTPSFYVNPTKGLYYCFGCQAKGNVFTFYQELYNMTFFEAVTNLAQRAGISLPDSFDINSHVKNKQHRDHLISICEQVKTQFCNNLFSPSGEKALKYLKERGLTPEVISQFKLGLSFNSSQSLWESLGDSYSEDIIQLGLRNQGKNGNFYDFFRNRIMFPIHDVQGNTIAFGGRSINDEVPKYLNSKESEVFHKKNNLYNINIAVRHLRQDPLIIVEGYMDVISLFQHGFKTVVATLGTSVAEEQLHIINQYDKSPIFCFDGDSAGLKATNKVIDSYLNIFEAGMNPRFIILESPYDPDSYIATKGKESFKKALSEAKSLSEMLWELTTNRRNIQLPEVSMLILKELESRVFKIKDKKLRAQYMFFFRNNIYNRSRNKSTVLYNSIRENKASQQILIDYENERDGILLACILLHIDILYEVEEQLSLCIFKNKKLEEIKNVLLTNANSDIADIKNTLIDYKESYDYIFNMSMVKPKIHNITSREEALRIFNESYNLISIIYLEKQKQETINEIKSLGAELKMIDKDELNKSHKDSIEKKIHILMGRQIEITKHINTLKLAKLD